MSSISDHRVRRDNTETQQEQRKYRQEPPADLNHLFTSMPRNVLIVSLETALDHDKDYK